MSVHSYRTMIDSDMGKLTLEAKYNIDPGQRGDWDTEPIPPSIEMVDVRIVQESIVIVDPDFLHHLEEEIREYEALQ